MAVSLSEKTLHHVWAVTVGRVQDGAGRDATRSQQGGPEHAKAPLVSIATPHASKLVSISWQKAEGNMEGREIIHCFWAACDDGSDGDFGKHLHVVPVIPHLAGHLWHPGEPCESLLAVKGP